MGLENRKLMRKLAAVITAAAIILPSAAVYADPDGLDTITSSGAADVVGAPADDNEAIGDDNANSGGNTDTSEDSSSDDLTNTTVGNDTADDEQEKISSENDASDDNTVTSEATAEPTATPKPKQTRLINGDFEYPQIYYNNFKTKSDFGDSNSLNGPWYVASRSTLKSLLNVDLDKFGWYTTAKDEKIELVVGKNDNGTDYMTGKENGSHYGNPDTDKNKKLYNNVSFEQICGRQYAELCGEDQSSLYQVISTKEGTVFDWKLKHRSCAYEDSKYKDMRDTMALFIGDASCISKDGNYENILKKKNAGTGKQCNDIFMWMAQLLKDKGIVKTVYSTTLQDYIIQEDSGTNKEFTIYSIDNIGDIDLNSITEDNYTDYFSLTPKGDFKKEWKCWIISNDKSDWGTPSGTYSVAEGQKESIFAFTALSGGKNYSGTINQGNLLDDVEFSASYPLKVSSTGGGSGTVVIDDNDYEVNDTVGLNKTHDGIYMEDTAVKVTATANTSDKCRFLGANI